MKLARSAMNLLRKSSDLLSQFRQPICDRDLRFDRRLEVGDFEAQGRQLLAEPIVQLARQLPAPSLLNSQQVAGEPLELPLIVQERFLVFLALSDIRDKGDADQVSGSFDETQVDLSRKLPSILAHTREAQARAQVTGYGPRKPFCHMALVSGVRARGQGFRCPARSTHRGYNRRFSP